MKKFTNSIKEKFLAKIPTNSIEDDGDTLTQRCRFNFHYMDFNQPPGQKFEDWSHDQLVKLLNKLKNYSEQSLNYWKKQPQRVGKRSHNVLEVYGEFPQNSDFVHPKHVPHQAQWARFRLGNLSRLIGFVLPDSYNNRPHPKTTIPFDCNTFYIVFLDQNHKFFTK